MKELNYKSPYKKSNVQYDGGYKTNNGIIRVIGNYKEGVLEYVTIMNHNEKKVHVTTKLIPELIEMLSKYK